jgi:Spy/CpxP family protein refolding chaperone
MTRTNVLALFAAGATMIFAQGPGPRTGEPPTPEQRIQMRVNMLGTRLQLTEAQKTNATSIFTQAYNSAASVRTSLDAARQAIADAVKKNDTATIDQNAATLGTLSGQLTAIDSKADAAFYAILTADQKAKYDEHPMGGPGGPGMGGRGPRGGGWR